MLDALNQPRPDRRRPSAPFIVGAIGALCLVAAIPAAVPAQDPGSALVDVLSGGKRSKETRTIQEHMDAWLTFNKDITAIAVDNVVLKLPEGAVQKRQVRLLSGAVGRTVVTLTYADGTIEQLVFTVKRDLSVLESAMKFIHPSIEVDIAPDRDAVVLTGLVPDGSYSARAAQAAMDYALSSRADQKTGGTGKVINLIRVQELASNLEQRLKSEIELFGGTGVNVRRIQQGSAADDTKDVFILSGTMPDNEGVVRATQLVRSAVGDRNLETPRVLVQMASADAGESIEGVIERAIHEQAKAPKVKVSRIAPPDPTGDSDILVLTGTVPSQTSLIQALTIASKVFQQQQIVKRKRDGEDKRVTEITAAGSTIISETIPLKVIDSDKDIRASADESGALRRSDTRNAGDAALLGVFSAGGQSSVGGTDFDTLINNQVDVNIARAKVIELAEGRVVSFLVVEDLPQVRVDIKLYELNRTALLEWDSNLRKAGVADFDTNGINPNSVARDADGSILTNANGDPLLGSEGTDIANVLSFLEGGLGNSFQVGGGHFAVDAAFRLLETQGVARSIASPTLTVLSGELAAFGDGGSVAVTQSITTNVGGLNGSAAVSESVQKLRFGIQLAVRPLVDEHGWITLDVVPSVSNPDFQLTQLVRTTTGTPQDTVAFSERSMRTSARLRDGETLLIGGLQDRSRKDTLTETPGLSKIPILGWLFQDKSFEDKDRELVISLNPSIVRDAPREARLWAYPSAKEMMPRKKQPPPPQEQQQQQQQQQQQPTEPAKQPASK
jgi:Flp pilus assembly secretin CpaC